jgi:acyl carrier protein phosphodiesterase
MNFLAHILLSGNNTNIMFGNFIGDFVKGNQLTQFPEEIQKGIIIHRFIDKYTDSHAVVLQSKLRLREKYHHYAPVIVDIYYDHFLAVLWHNYHEMPLLAFTENFYAQIGEMEHLLPDRAKGMMPFMIKDNWLYNYRTLTGIERVFMGMSRRSKFNSGMETATIELQAHYSLFQSEFEAFFPDLKYAVDQQLEIT